MAIVAKEIWSDLHQSLKTDAQGSIKKVINIEAVKTSIDNILRTAKGTRVMLRNFGSDLKGMLFENIDNSLKSKREVSTPPAPVNIPQHDSGDVLLQNFVGPGFSLESN